MNRVLKGGPWCFNNQLLMLKRLHKGMIASNVKLECASLWVQIWGAPFDKLSTKVATEVGSRLGNVEDVERRRRQDMQNFFMRVQVALPISKTLRRGGFISDSDGVGTWVTFKYERLPIFCHYCGLLGHDLRHCARHYAMEKNGGEIEYQYGDWLKVAGSRQRSPPCKEETEEEAGAWRSENLGENFSQYADQAENQGIEGSSQMVCHEKQGIEEVDDYMVPLEVVDKCKSGPTDADTKVGNLNENYEEKGVVDKLMSDGVGSSVGNLEPNLEMP